MIHIPSELAVTVIVSPLGDGSSGKIHCLRILTKRLVPKPHGGFPIQVHKLLFALSHFCIYGKMPIASCDEVNSTKACNRP